MEARSRPDPPAAAAQARRNGPSHSGDAADTALPDLALTPVSDEPMLAGRQPEAGPAPQAGQDEHTSRLARGLDLGAWIEFRSARGTRRALRLNWSSQQRGAYLFANLQGDDTLIMATTRLAERLRDGTARILSRDSLTERAVAQLMTTVAGDPAPAPAD